VLATWLLAVAALARWSPRNGGAFFPYRLVTGAALGLAIGSKWNSVVLLGPDFLQLGSDWGSMKQGEFNGPAVNHCAGRAARRA
jgi:4-amino-4-deoxy-L-arabinose transferase-like glycosyltransferase